MSRGSDEALTELDDHVTRARRTRDERLTRRDRSSSEMNYPDLSGDDGAAFV